MDQLPDSITELIQFLDSESDRFWRRFHIFAALQVGAMLGFAKIAEVLKSHGAAQAQPAAFRLMLLFMTLFSFVGAIDITRGCDLQLALAQAINDIYGEFHDESIGPNIYQAVSRHSYFRDNTGTITASLFAWLCATIWPVAWFYFRNRGFTLDALSTTNGCATPAGFGKRRMITAGLLGAVLFILMVRVSVPSSIPIVLTHVIVAIVVVIGFACVSVHVSCEVPAAIRMMWLSSRPDRLTEESPRPRDEVDADGTGRQ